MPDIFDIMIFESGDGGELLLENGDLATISGLTNQVYLALFGGNIEQDTSDELDELDNRSDWWGNSLIGDEAQFNSTFERALNSVALTTNGISVLEDAAKEDLEFLSEIANVEVEGSIPDINKFQLDVKLTEPDGVSTKIKFLWDGTKSELIQTIKI